MMLLTFLEAKKILRHRDRLPNKDLKLRVVTLLSSCDRFPLEFLTNVVGFGFRFGFGRSNFTGFQSPCLALGLELLLGEEGGGGGGGGGGEEAVKRDRFRGFVWKEEKVEKLEEEEHLMAVVAQIDEFHDHPNGDWAAMPEHWSTEPRTTARRGWLGLITSYT
ncbi:hypothetical protein ACFX1X_020873 [Malus domestica]